MELLEMSIQHKLLTGQFGWGEKKKKFYLNWRTSSYKNMLNGFILVEKCSFLEPPKMNSLKEKDFS